MNPNLDLSIVVPTHNRADSVVRTVKSILNQNYDKSKYEILVIANPHAAAVESEMIGLQAQAQPVKYLTSGLGVNTAKNVGIERARGGVVFFLDDDCELFDNEHLNKLMSKFKNDTVHGCGGGYLTPKDLRSTVANSFNLQSNLWLQQFINNQGHASQLLGGNAAYRREVFKNVIFNENILYGGDEVDFNSRLVAKGLSLFFSTELSVLHHAEVTYRQFFKKAISHGINLNKYCVSAKFFDNTVPPVKLQSALTVLARRRKNFKIKELRLFVDIFLFQAVLRLCVLKLKVRRQLPINNIVPHTNHNNISGDMA